MCLAHPAQVTAIHDDNDMATVELGQVKLDVSLALVDDVQVGDYVLVHVGYALNRLSEDEALHTLALMKEVGISEVLNS